MTSSEAGRAEPIPREELERARRRLSRHVAAMIVEAMAETDTSLEQLDVRLAQGPGTAGRWLSGLINCTSSDLDLISDMCLAMGAEPRISFRAAPRPRAPEAAPEAAPPA